MKILMINKFLYPNGGSETYIIKLGEALTKLGHEVQYFGMDHKDRTLGNAVGAYTQNMDFHNSGMADKLKYPIKTIYNAEARKKIRKVLNDFKPDVCHINNFNYQLTPSIILEINKWRKETGHACKIVYTAHDVQLVCPNHMAFNPGRKEKCLKCIHGQFGNCVKGKCIHGSAFKSLIGTAEAEFWNIKKVYRLFDTIICCSDFMKTVLDNNPILKDKTVAIHNFISGKTSGKAEKDDYIIYFGRYSFEKGMEDLINVCKKLPDVNFVFAGKGDYEDELSKLPNVRNVGFKTGEELDELISKARFSVYPSIWYENCPYSVMESIALGTPVLGPDSGGIPELIREGVTGRLYDGDNKDALLRTIKEMWEDSESTEALAQQCNTTIFLNENEYCEKIIEYYS